MWWWNVDTVDTAVAKKRKRLGAVEPQKGVDNRTAKFYIIMHRYTRSYTPMHGAGFQGRANIAMLLAVSLSNSLLIFLPLMARSFVFAALDHSHTISASQFCVQEMHSGQSVTHMARRFLVQCSLAMRLICGCGT